MCVRSARRWHRKEVPCEEVIAESILMDSRLAAATVHDGIVTLAGRPETDQAARDLVEAVRHIEGVIAVRDQLTYPGTSR